MKHLQRRSMANLSGWGACSSQTHPCCHSTYWIYQSFRSFQKQLEIYLHVSAKIQENSLTDQLVTKRWKQVRCNNKKTILEKPAFPSRFFQKVLETSVQWNLDLMKGQATGKMCLPYWQGFVISRFFFISYYDWGKENRLLYRTSLYRVSLYRGSTVILIVSFE